MRTLLNVVWLVLCGFWMFLAYVVAGLVLCVTIIGIPFGLAAFRIGFYALWPFGYTAIDRPDAGAPSFVANILWLVLVELVARSRPHLHGHRAVRHDHRHPAGPRQLQADPDLADAAGQGDRADRPAVRGALRQGRPHGPTDRPAERNRRSEWFQAHCQCHGPP